MYEGSKEEVIRNNLLQFEMQTEGKTPEIDFNELIFKAKRIPVKQYVEYKREIRLSKLKQVDIAANITDMKNLIVKADEELEENIGTEKKSMEEVNIAVKGSRDELEAAKNEKLKSNKKLIEVKRACEDTKNKRAHVDHAIRELKEKIALMQENRDFLTKIFGFEEDRIAEFKKFDGILLSLRRPNRQGRLRRLPPARLRPRGREPHAAHCAEQNQQPATAREVRRAHRTRKEKPPAPRIRKSSRPGRPTATD